MSKIKILLIFCIILFPLKILFPQIGWHQQLTYTNNYIGGVSFPNSQTGYATGWYGTILKTTNGGDNWDSIYYSQQLGFQSVSFVNVNTGWICGQNGTILKTTNGGYNWSNQVSGYSGHLFLITFINSQTGWIVGDTGTILKTTNEGINWIAQTSGTNVNLISVCFTSINDGWISGDNGIILKTTNSGLNWITVSTSVTNNFGKLFFVSANTGWIPGTNGIILKTTNGGNSWSIQGSGTSSYLVCANFWNSDTGYICGAEGTILKTTNGGDNWVQQLSGSVDDLHFISFISHTTGWACGFNGTVLKTTTGGVSYIVGGYAKYSDNNQPVTSGIVKAVKLNKSNGSIVVVDSAQLQSDGSYTLSHVPQDTVDIGIYPNSTTQNDFIITHYPSTIYWENSTLLCPSGNISNINIGAIRSTSYIANNSVNGKVMRITNSAVSNVKDAILYAKLGNTFVRCGMTDGNGVYHLQSLPAGNLKIIVNRFGFTGDSTNVTITSTSNVDSINFYLRFLYVGIKKIESTIPSEFKLYQNYPNPFNPTTNIKYNVKSSQFIKLIVYDILGKEVAALVNEKQSPGVYEITWDASQSPSGIYFYRLQAGEFTETKKMLMIK